MNTTKIAIGTLVGVIIFYVLSNFIVDRKLSDIESQLIFDINEQLETVSNTATLLGRGAATESITKVIVDCSALDVTRYDSLLSSLDRGLNNPELVELKNLFDRCGDVASVRRSSMVLVLTEQVKSLSMLVNHYQSLGKDLEEANLINDWQELVSLEQEISNNFNLLVSAQGNIIAALISDTPSSALTVENIRVEAEEIRSRLTELTGTAAPLRSRLIAL